MAAKILDFFLHIDTKLGAVIQHYGQLAYAILFVVIFLETGAVFTPFLPGDSLLFAAGAFASKGIFSPWILVVLLSLATIAGDAANYWVGRSIGTRIEKSLSPFISRDYLARTEGFYHRHGKRTIIFARFIPIIRTFAPFVAGIGRMRYAEFFAYNVIGGISWIVLFVFGGYFFGNLPAVEHNFSLVILGIIVVSLVPTVIELLRHRGKRQ